ncbi:hypothetical protein HMPREF0620_1623 [Parascardovia denticolens DSM 10105 = JCM 12538]|uniref:Uncharacterized protein n=1 Tax=Parascardovia denticolens DSM 10105 = JCM 12538 TaxID=864564 RepID=E6K2F0_PARDN|nr:hypothetical protein HMPREF0620_1623 [Parascardovia denticolens DSM 10105 = JCM 12538]
MQRFAKSQSPPLSIQLIQSVAGRQPVHRLPAGLAGLSFVPIPPKSCQ